MSLADCWAAVWVWLAAGCSAGAVECAGALPGAAVRLVLAGQPVSVSSRTNVQVMEPVLARKERLTNEVVFKITINLDIVRV